MGITTAIQPKPEGNPEGNNDPAVILGCLSLTCQKARGISDRADMRGNSYDFFALIGAPPPSCCPICGRVWWATLGLNQRPHPYQGCALPAELVAHTSLTTRKRFADGDAQDNPSIHLIFFHRKEVIQPQVPLRLPCYDFTPVTDPTVAGCILTVSAPSSGRANSHGVTGGVYKARERIHRGMLIRDY